MNYATLSAAEIDSLLLGLRQTPANASAATAEKASDRFSPFVQALQSRLTQTWPDLHIDSVGLSDAQPLEHVLPELRRKLEAADEFEVICDRELIASIVDYRFGGHGLPRFVRSEHLSVTERRASDALFDALRAARHACAPDFDVALDESTAQQGRVRCLAVVFKVRIGLGGGMLGILLPRNSEPAAETTVALELSGERVLIANLARIRLAEDAVERLRVGDLVAVKIEPSIEIDFCGLHLCCRHGAHDGRHALRVSALTPLQSAFTHAACAPGEVELTLELGRAEFSEQALRELAPGQLIDLGRPIREPLSLMRGTDCFGMAEVLVLPDGPAVRIVALQS